MEVAELWRYPVKSLGGEQVDEAEVTPSGLMGDRTYAIFDATTGLGLTARRAPEMLFARARWRDDGAVQITLPDGQVSRGDDDLSEWLGRPVTLRAANQVEVRLYEATSDPDENESTWSVFSGASGAFHDSGRAKVTLVSVEPWATGTVAGSAPTSSLRAAARTTSSTERSGSVASSCG